MEDQAEIGVLPFCPCLRNGEDTESQYYSTLDTPIRWRAGEYDVMSTEEVYVAVAGHRAVCQIQPDLVTRKDA